MVPKILYDVNVPVYAFRGDSPHFSAARAALGQSLTGGEQSIFCPTVAASFLRIVTNPGIFRQPAARREAWSFLEVSQDHPSAAFKTIDAMTCGILRRITLIGGENGNAIPDALLAGREIRHSALVVNV